MEKPPDGITDLNEFKRKKAEREMLESKKEIDAQLLKEKPGKKILGEEFTEMNYFTGGVLNNEENKMLWKALGEFAKKVAAIGKTNDNMVEIDALKTLPNQDLADILLKSNPEDWQNKPLYYIELHRVIEEKINPKSL